MKLYTTILISTIVLFSACNTNKDLTLFKNASEKSNAKNYSEALKDYQEIINEYSDSEKAAESIFAVAAMYHMYQIPNVSREESLKKAVEYYQKLYRLFPKDERAPKALFMSGFILANELNNLDAARLAYMQFLDKFPKHELANPVKMELDNLGKTPEEILQQRTAKK
ncbi:MAG: hypothetical protein A3J84_03370 [Ignavibacteria bacterium RIFOXYA2_FULL_37_17]|nr:MAG: hypothetical protein A3J84_03370 [Ignavibacteria bacterium RIFOXYA2_FULL_37_17]